MLRNRQGRAHRNATAEHLCRKMSAPGWLGCCRLVLGLGWLLAAAHGRQGEVGRCGATVAAGRQLPPGGGGGGGAAAASQSLTAASWRLRMPSPDPGAQPQGPARRAASCCWRCEPPAPAPALRQTWVPWLPPVIGDWQARNSGRAANFPVVLPAPRLCVLAVVNVAEGGGLRAHCSSRSQATSLGLLPPPPPPPRHSARIRSTLS